MEKIMYRCSDSSSRQGHRALYTGKRMKNIVLACHLKHVQNTFSIYMENKIRNAKIETSKLNRKETKAVILNLKSFLKCSPAIQLEGGNNYNVTECYWTLEHESLDSKHFTKKEANNSGFPAEPMEFLFLTFAA